MNIFVVILYRIVEAFAEWYDEEQLKEQPVLVKEEQHTDQIQYIKRK